MDFIRSKKEIDLNESYDLFERETEKKKEKTKFQNLRLKT